ncbi:MAG: hypothetical protein Q9162_001845 [Coniocarpon cinnabarinum]
MPKLTSRLHKVEWMEVELMEVKLREIGKTLERWPVRDATILPQNIRHKKYAPNATVAFHLHQAPRRNGIWQESLERGDHCRRALHGLTAAREGTVESPTPRQIDLSSPLPSSDPIGIRERLRFWKAPELSPEETEVAEWEHQQVALGHAESDYMRSDLQVKEEDGFDEAADDDTFMPEFDRMSEDYERSDSSTSLFRPGDIVELPGGGGGKPALAVFLKNTQNYSLMYNHLGRLFASMFGQAHFNCRNLITENELAPIMAHLPEDPFIDKLTLITEFDDVVPRSAGAHVLKKLDEFSSAVHEAFMTHSEVLRNVHDLVAHPTQAETMLLSEIAAVVLGLPMPEAHNIPEHVLLAISHSCIRTQFGFKVANRSYVMSRTLLVESKQSVATVERVTQWIRAYQEEASLKIRGLRASSQTRSEAKPIHAFASKAQQLIAASKQMRVYTPQGAIIGTKPEYLNNPKQAEAMIQTRFDDTDRDIIHFLSLCTAGRAFFYHPHLVGLPTIIVRAVKGHEDFTANRTEIDIDAIHTLLVEIGVAQPFENPEAIDRELVVHDEALEHIIDDQYKKLAAGMSVEETAQLEDVMDSLRHDWGDLPVYCIDSASTTEVDDGISLEPHASEPGHAWLHVHVAHYSSHITQDHVLARLAENQHSSHYLPEGKLPMMPEFMSKKFSVQSKAPVITVSMHLDADAMIVDYRVRPAFVRNVHTIHSEQVDRYFGGNHTNQNTLSIPVMVANKNLSLGSSSASKEEPPTFHGISDDHQPLLQQLLEISQKIRRRRPVNQQFFRTDDRFHVTVADQPRDPRTPAHRLQPAASTTHSTPTAPSYALQFPDLALNVNFEDSASAGSVPAGLSPASLLVSEIMVLANTIAGRYAAERDLPVVFYGTAPAAKGIEKQLPIMRQRLQRMVAGKEPFEQNFFKYTRSAFALRQLSTRPIRQVPMDLEAYAKITSPLRRYYDLVSLWQIDAAMKYELETGKSLKVREMGPGWFMSPSSTVENITEMGPAESSSPREHIHDLSTSTQVKVFRPPFTHSELQHLLARTHLPERSQMRFLYSHQKHHIMQLFARALYLSPETICPYYRNPTRRPGPDVLNPPESKFAAIVNKSGNQRRGFILEGLGVVCDTEQAFGSEDGRTPLEGERWAVRVQRVRLGSKRVQVEALRRLDV